MILQSMTSWLSAILCLCHHVTAFSLLSRYAARPAARGDLLWQQQQKPPLSLSSSSSMIDFDYEAPNPGSLRYETDLPSAYPSGMPAGLRGEAVRSALKSGRCIAWSLHGTPLAHGLLQVQGSGCLDFLNNKLSNSFVAASSSSYKEKVMFREAALLTARGRMVDRVGVAVNRGQEQAWIQTSPRHEATDLFARLDPFVFPMDQVTLQSLPVFGFTLASIRRQDVVHAFDKYIRPELDLSSSSSSSSYLRLPTAANECLVVTNKEDGSLQLLAIPTVNLPECAAVGYTFWLADQAQGQQIWQSLTSDTHTQGPVPIGALEYESLRIQAGQPGYGAEMTGRQEKDKDLASTPATPLELHQGDSNVLDLEKGCYMGQEGVASVVKNPRGPPRLLHQVVFDDEFNLYDSETAGEAASSTPVENLTRLPQPGDTLYVLGSNEEISVGTLTSVAEPSSTGDAQTVGLALVRRSDSILRAMQKRDLEIPCVYDVTEQETSGIIQPPPMDPLDGLEVILEGSFTVGTLRSIPPRRVPRGQNMFVEKVSDSDSNEKGIEVTRVPLAGGQATGDVYEPRGRDLTSTTGVEENEEIYEAEWERDDVVDESTEEKGEEKEDDEADLEQARLEAEAAKAAAEDAAAEAQRKAEKMELLQKRAQEAMARRKAKNNQQKE